MLMEGDSRAVQAKVMLVAGGTGSIGGEIARQALACGWHVALHGKTAASVDAAAARLELKGDWSGFAAELAHEGVDTLVERVGGQLGRIDAVVDCISGGPPGIIGRFPSTDPRAYAAFYDASIAHLQRLAHASLPWLQRQGGTLIAFASDAGRFAAPNQTMIGTSRAAIMAFVRNLAVEVARDGVRTHCISPSYVEGSKSFLRAEAAGSTRIDQARRRAGLGLPTAADIAPLVLFLCSEGARRITGQVISVNGGLNA
jgi:NAD(P)-dependent dehydrogenase (short-subunit alcohol dehydrogenase family)